MIPAHKTHAQHGAGALEAGLPLFLLAALVLGYLVGHKTPPVTPLCRLTPARG